VGYPLQDWEIPTYNRDNLKQLMKSRKNLIVLARKTTRHTRNSKGQQKTGTSTRVVEWTEDRITEIAMLAIELKELGWSDGEVNSLASNHYTVQRSNLIQAIAEHNRVHEHWD